MAIQENGTSSLDYFAMLRGCEMCRADLQSGKLKSLYVIKDLQLNVAAGLFFCFSLVLSLLFRNFATKVAKLRNLGIKKE